MINTPIMMMTTIMAIMPGKMTVSAIDAGACGVGVAVAAGSMTVNAVVAVYGQ